MHALESFSVVATILGVPRKLNFDSLGGLTIAGLRADEARTIAEVLERGTADKPLLVAERAQPAAPSVRANKAKWGPKAAVSGEIVDKPAESPRVASPEPAPSDATPEAPVDCGASEAAAVSAETPQDATPACAADHGLGDLDAGAPADLEKLAADPSVDTVVGPEECPGTDAPGGCAGGTPLSPGAVLCADCNVAEIETGRDDVDTERPAEVEALAEELNAVPPEEVMPDEPKPTLKNRKTNAGKKAPLRPEELKKLKLPSVGEEHEGSAITDAKDHPDGGRMIIRADGWRVKFDKNGKEVARMEGVPAEAVDVIKTGAEIQAESSTAEPGNDEKAEEAPSSKYPAKIMETRVAREVVSYLLDNGVDKDDLVGVCLKLKADGAAAFTPTKDEAGVQRRVNAALLVLGRA